MLTREVTVKTPSDQACVYCLKVLSLHHMYQRLFVASVIRRLIRTMVKRYRRMQVQKMWQNGNVSD